MIQNFLHLPTPLTSREFSDMQSLTLGVVLHVCITLPFYFLTKLFYKGLKPERQKEVDQFFENISTEVVSEGNEEEDALDNRQRNMLGKLILVLGVFVLLLIFIPNPPVQRLIFVAVGGIIMLVGGGLYVSSKPRKNSKISTK